MELAFLLLASFVIAMVVFITKILKGTQAATPAASDKSDEELLAQGYHLMALAELLRQAKLYGDTDTAVEVNNMTYNGPLPVKLPDGTYTSVYELQHYNIAGINYREGISDYLGDFDGYLKPDPTNEHDPNAIAIFHKDGHHLGFINAGCTDAIRAIGRPFPLEVTGTIEQEHDDIDNRDYFVGTVFLYALRQPNPAASNPNPTQSKPNPAPSNQLHDA